MTLSQSAEFAAGLRSGRMQGVPFPDLLWSLSRCEATGVLHVSREGVEKQVFFDRGHIVFAASNDPDDRLGERLLREGRVTVDRLERAVAQLPSEKRIGALLVEAGSLDENDLTEGVVQQLRDMVVDLFSWVDGEYEFREGSLPHRESITLELETGELMLMGVRGVRSFGRIRGSVGPPSTVFGLSDEWERAVEGIRLSEGEELLLERLRHEDASVARLCREVFLSNFEIYQTLWGLKLLRVIEERPHRSKPGEAIESGLLEERDFADVLVALSRDKATGVLYVTAGVRERSFHFLEGRCHFATSNDIDDGLVAYLLRRGVISLADREETARRLLSNKRVGTILREMGVIDDRDLEEMVRQQLLEVVFETFCWPRGEFSFFPDNLPSIEEITLDVATERLVAEGLCRIDSWRRVEEGCGGLDAYLELTPAYLETLDHMGVGEDEWSVITALKEGGTPRELCARSTLGDFRICQILWGLRLLGAVRQVERPSQEEVAVEPDAAGLPAPVAGEEGEADSGIATDDEDVTVPDTVPEAEVDVAEEPETSGECEEEAPAVIEVTDETAPDVPLEVIDAAAADDEEREAGGDLAVDRNAEPHDDDGVAGEGTRSSGGPEQDGGESAPQFEVAEPEQRDDDTGPVSIRVEDASTGPMVPMRPEDDPDESDESDGTQSGGAEVPLDATQRIRAEDLRAALESGSDPDPDPARDDQEDDEEEQGETGDQTQWISADALKAALAGSATDATQQIDPDDIRAAVEADPIEAALEATADVSSEAIEVRVEEMDDTVRTVGLPRDEVEAALVTGVGGDDPWAPPSGLEDMIGRFNAIQRIVYRAVKAEVGAGAANFIRSCCTDLDHGETLSGVELQGDGTWDCDGLRRAVVDARVDEPWDGYQELIDRELDMLRVHIGDGRVGEIQRQVRQIESADG